MLPVIYTYPDSTKSLIRPKDGQVFCLWNSNQTLTGMWQWDDFKGHWYDIMGKAPTKVEFFDPNEVSVKVNGKEIDGFRTNKCECGSEKAGSNRHSSWCQKYSA